MFLQYGKYNFLSLIAFAVSASIFTMLFWKALAGVIKKPAPPLPRVLTEGIPEAQLRSYADKATPVVNSTLRHVGRALDGTAPLFSLGVAVAFFTIGKLAAIVPLLLVVYSPVFLAFTVPKVYELKKDEIDRAITIGREQATVIHDKFLQPIISKIPRAQPPAPAESSSFRKNE